MESKEEKLQLFISITDVENTAVALQILEQNNWDVDSSVNFYFNTSDIVDYSSPNTAGSGSKSSGTPGSKSPPLNHGQMDVDDDALMAAELQKQEEESQLEQFRDPIPQMMDTLVESNHFEMRQRRQQYQKPTNVFETFRDFERERGLNQDNLTGKQKTLAELFKPPLDILSFGNFDQIKQLAQEKKRFILVNVQDVSEFGCQRLNRDTWSNAKLKEIISKSFIFWQVNAANEEGKWFAQYYPTYQYPYISIIDPRTGEEMANTSGFIEPDEMSDILNTFISTHSYEKASKIIPTEASKDLKKKKYRTEEEELEWAIQLSLGGGANPNSNNIQDDKSTSSTSTTTSIPTSTQTTTSTSTSKKDEEMEEDDMEEDDYNDLEKHDNTKEIEEIKKKSEEQPPSNIGMEGDCVIQIKLPEQTLKGNFKSTDLIKNVYYFVQLKSGKFNFKLLTTFPKVELTGPIMNKTLKEMDLTPRAQLMFQQD